MSLESVRRFLAEKAPDIASVDTEASSATVPLAAAAHGVAPGQIAKTLSLRVGDRVVLAVTRGDARISNQKARAAKEEQAQENRARFGRTKDEKKLEEALDSKAKKDLDAHKRED